MQYLKDLDYDPSKQSVILAGSTQTGKTTHAKSLVKALSVNGFNIVILDNKRRFTSLDPSKVVHTIQDITGQGLQILHFYCIAVNMSPNSMQPSLGLVITISSWGFNFKIISCNSPSNFCLIREFSKKKGSF